MRPTSLLRPLLLPLLLLLPRPAAAQSPVFGVQGDSDPSGLGSAVSAVGDVDGDGYADLLVGAPLASVAGPESGLVRVISGLSGLTLFEIAGDDPLDQLGGALAGPGDVSGDGVPDLLLGAWRDETGGKNAGLARVHSGAGGAALPGLEFHGALVEENLGFAVAGAGDFDADGVPDLLIGAPGAGPLGSLLPGRALVVSGANGTPLAQFVGEGGADGLGWSVSGAGDVDADGFADTVIGAVGADAAGQNSGKVYVFHGPVGGTGSTFVGDAAFESLGLSVAGAGDLDLDGKDDLVAGAPFHPGGGFDRGLTRAFSGGTGAVLWTAVGQANGEWSGWSVAGAGDVNGDGRADVLSGVPFAPSGVIGESPVGGLRLLSGANGAVLWETRGETAFSQYGWSVAGLGELNADGVPDVAVGADQAPVGTVIVGSATVLSGAPAGIEFERHLVSLADGWSVPVDLDAGAAHAGKLYLLVGTTSGISPGLTASGLTIPINVDAYTQHTLANPNSPPLVSGFGTLGALGRASAAFQFPAGGNPGLAGLTLHHAFVAFGALGVDYASLPVPVNLLP